MEYSTAFQNLISNAGEDYQYIGIGNPNAKILFIGKEAAISRDDIRNLDTHAGNLEEWKRHITNGTEQNQSYIPETGSPLRDAGHTWRKYQKLKDYIRDTEGGNIGEERFRIDFLQDVFTTEMSETPYQNSREAVRHNEFNERLAKRKQTFFRSDFIQQFPVVVLACGLDGRYIRNIGEGEDRQIDNIFNVRFIETKVVGNTKFHIHKSPDKNKLVIHTRQLSNSCSDQLLRELADEIRGFQN